MWNQSTSPLVEKSYMESNYFSIAIYHPLFPAICKAMLLQSHDSRDILLPQTCPDINSNHHQSLIWLKQLSHVKAGIFKYDIRQGDPFPLTFSFLGWSLILLTKAEEMGSLQGVRVAKGGPSISHLLFANNSFIFCNACIKEARGTKNLLKTTVIFQVNSLIFINLPSILVRGLAIRDANVLQRSSVWRLWTKMKSTLVIACPLKEIRIWALNLSQIKLKLE